MKILNNIGINAVRKTKEKLNNKRINEDKISNEILIDNFIKNKKKFQIKKKDEIKDLIIKMMD